MKEIKLTQGLITLVDDEDYEYLNQWKWIAVKLGYTYYAARNHFISKKRTTLSMHRVIMNTPKGIEVDHIDHNGLNNQKSNLRNCSHKQNIWNRSSRKNTKSKYLGVTLQSTKHKYIIKEGIEKITISKPKYTAHISANGKTIYLGSFNKEKDAAIAYNKAAINLYGSYANINVEK